jgi:hypothetical protein
MMNCELEFQAEINETNIRKLIYVYTLGMQYYNLKEKEEFENYYRNKLNNLLLNENVINYLDSHKVDLSKKVDLNLFPEDNKNNNNDNKSENTTKTTKNDENTTNIKKSSMKKSKVSHDDTEIRRSPSLDFFKKKSKINKNDIREYVIRKIKEVDIKLKSIDKQVSNNIVEQMSAFESNKRNKKKKKTSSSSIGEDKEDSNELKRKDSIEELLKNEPEKIEKRPVARRRGSSIGQTRFMKEVEEYVEQNMKEMYKAIEELRQSYEGEINEAVESGFEEIAESLRSDLKFEEENLTAQYEEERMKQIELIREKHKKK